MLGQFPSVRTSLKESPLASRFINGAAWSFLGSVVSSGCTLITLMLLARLLGKDSYGQFVVIQSTLIMVGVFAGFGIGSAASRYSAELKTSSTVRLGQILALAERTLLGFGCLVSAALMISSATIAKGALNAPNLRTPIAIAAVAVVFAALDGFQKSVLIGLESMRAFATASLVGSIAAMPIMLLAANLFGLHGAAAALAINAFMQASISRYQMNRELKTFSVQRTSQRCLGEAPVLWQFAFPALLAGAVVAPAHWTAQAILANSANGYAELAVLGIAMQWFNVIMFIPGTAARVVLPMLTERVTKSDKAGSRRILIYAMEANAAIAIPMAAVFSVLSPYIMSLYGNKFTGNHTALTIAIITAALLAIITPVGNLLAASSKMWLGAAMNAGWAVIYVGLTYYLVATNAIETTPQLGSVHDHGASSVTLSLSIAYAAHVA